MKGGEDTFRIRVFAEHMAAATKVIIKDLTTLDAYPNLILYEGAFSKKYKAAKLERRYLKT
jgi:hypothetical protein